MTHLGGLESIVTRVSVSVQTTPTHAAQVGIISVVVSVSSTGNGQLVSSSVHCWYGAGEVLLETNQELLSNTPRIGSE